MSETALNSAQTHFNLNTYYDQQFKEHSAVIKASYESLQGDFTKLVDMCTHSLKKGGKILFFGNGGSAADAQHLATELTVRFINNRPAIAALALTTDTSALTAIGNDFGFEYLFSRQIEALGRPEDLAIGITTSGKSPNIIQGFKAAKFKGLPTVALTGGNGGLLPELGTVDLMITVPSTTTSRIQEIHIMIGQMLCGALEYQLGYTS